MTSGVFVDSRGGSSAQNYNAIVPGTVQTVAYTATAGTITNAVGASTTLVRVMLTTAGYIKFGTSPTATTSDIPMAANVPEYFGITPGYKVSAIRASADGVLSVVEAA